MFNAFGLAGPKFYTNKPPRQLREFRLRCRTGTKGEAYHEVVAEDYDLDSAMRAVRAAGYRFIMPLL